jgi:hypothetical protein
VPVFGDDGDHRGQPEGVLVTDIPKRIQRSRRKGYRKPEGAIVVARPSRWGNPFTIASAWENGFTEGMTPAEARAFVAGCFDSWLAKGPQSEWWFEAGKERFIWMQSHLSDLRGQDLACWCPDEHCHASVLLRLANA